MDLRLSSFRKEDICFAGINLLGRRLSGLNSLDECFAPLAESDCHLYP
jgi:hypothetical protein